MKKIQIQRDALVEALGEVSVATTKREDGITSHVLINAAKDEAVIEGTDNEIRIETRCAIEPIGTRCKCTAPAKKLYDICRTFRTGEVEIERIGKRVRVSQGRAKFTLNTFEPDDFPETGARSAVAAFTGSAGDLRRAMVEVGHAIGEHDVRAYLNGMLIDKNGRSVTAVGTDANRLAVLEMEVEEEQGDGQWILPRKVIGVLRRRLGESDEPVRITMGESTATFEHDGRRIETRFISGGYPNYRQVIGTESETPCVVNRQELESALARVRIVASDRKAMTMTIEGSQMLLEAASVEHEEANEIVDMSYGGERIEVGINPLMVHDAVSVMNSENVELHLRDPLQSVLIVAGSGEGDEGLSITVMPMRI